MIVLKNKNKLNTKFNNKDMIKLAKNEIKEWQKFLKHLQNNKL